MDGKSAVKYLEGQPSDLIVLDLMLPGVSGFEVCRRVRADANWYTVPVLFISAMSAQEEIDHGLAQGGDDFIAKPFQIEQFAGRVQGLLTSSTEDRLVDKLTTLTGAVGMKLRVQNLVNHRKRFSLVYIELLATREFGLAAGEEARALALRHFARALHQCGSQLRSSSFYIGHMGGGHFVCVIDPELVDKFSSLALTFWGNYLPTFFEKVNRPALFKQGRDGDTSGVPLLDALLCSTQHSTSTPTTAKKLLDTLSRLRATAHASEASGLFKDRRG
jgi:CheY-like chemotaxis protein